MSLVIWIIVVAALWIVVAVITNKMERDRAAHRKWLTEQEIKARNIARRELQERRENQS